MKFLFYIVSIIYKILITRKRYLFGIKNKDNFEIYCKKFVINPPSNTKISLDLGCSNHPKNPFNSKIVYGLDLQEDKTKKIFFCNLGFDKLNFENDSIDYITAFDLIEHIPRIAFINGKQSNPFIFLMNEIYRILKKDGYFLSVTPIFPFRSAFQDPTHHNFITKDTFDLYFSNRKLNISNTYGIKTNFKIVNTSIWQDHLVALLKK